MADLDGFEAMMAELRSYVERVSAATPGGLARAAAHLEDQAKTLLGLTSHPPGTPTPSPPGSPPSLITGNLRRSIQVEGPTVVGAGRWRIAVGANTVYARIQELGGQAGQGGRSNLPARPYMAPALAASLPGMGALMEQAWADALG